MVAAWAKVEERDRDADKYPDPKYSSISEVKYCVVVEELKGLQLQLDTDNDEMRAALRAICLTRPEKSKADLARIVAAVSELDKIRDRKSPFTVQVSVLRSPSQPRSAACVPLGSWFAPCVNVAAVAAPHLNLLVLAPQTWIDCFGDVFDDRVRIKVQLD